MLCLLEPCWVSNTLLQGTSKVTARGLVQLQPRYPGHHPTFSFLQLLPEHSTLLCIRFYLRLSSLGVFSGQREEGDPGRGTDSSVPGGAAALHTEPRECCWALTSISCFLTARAQGHSSHFGYPGRCELIKSKCQAYDTQLPI